MIVILTCSYRLYMQSVLRVQQENAPNIEEWYRQQQEGATLFFYYDVSELLLCTADFNFFSPQSFVSSIIKE